MSSIPFEPVGNLDQIAVPIGAAAAVGLWQGEVALVVRPDGTADLPGDVLRSEPDPEQVAQRAALEQTGAELDTLRLVGYLPFPWGAMVVFAGSVRKLHTVKVDRRSRGRLLLEPERAARRFDAGGDAALFAQAYAEAVRRAVAVVGD